MSEAAHIGRNRRKAVQMAISELPNGTEEEIVELAASLAYEMNREFVGMREDRQARNVRNAKAGTNTVGALPGAMNAGSPLAFMNQAQRLADRSDYLPFLGGVAGGMGGGGLTGSMLGAGAGALVDSSLDRIANKASEDVIKLPGANEAGQDPLREFRNAATLEFLGGKFVDKTLGAGARFLRGSADVAEGVMRNMDGLGIGPSLQDISNTGLVEGARRILGGFPLLARPFAKRQRAVSEALKAKSDEMIVEVFPDVLVLRDYAEKHGIEAAARVSEQLTQRSYKQLDRAFKIFGEKQEAAWGKLASVSDRLKAAGNLPSEAPIIIKERGKQALSKFAKFATKVGEGGSAQSLTGDAARIHSWINGRVRKLPEQMDFNQLREAKRSIQQQIDTVEEGTDEFRALVAFKEGVEEQMRHNAKGHPELWAAYQNANKVSEEFLTLIEDVAARRLRRINRLVGRRERDVVETGAGEATKNSGSLQVSQTLDEIATGAKTVEEVRQLYGAMKDGLGEEEARKLFGQAVARRIDTALNSAFKEAVEKSGDDLFKPGVLLRKLNLDGLVNPRSPATAETQAMVEMLKASGLKPQRIVQLSKTIDAIFSTKNPNVSDFIRRRGLLGGMSSIISGVTGGMIGGATTGSAEGASVGAMLGPLMFLGVGYGFGKVVTSPRMARWVVAAADSNSPLHARARAVNSILNAPLTDNLFGDDDPAVVEFRNQIQNKLRTRKGREEFFRQIDESFDFSRIK